MLDGATTVKGMFEEAAKHKMPAVAMTDQGNMFGANEFYTTSLDYDVKPIIGIEAYIAPDSRYNMDKIVWGEPHQRADDVVEGGAYTHMTLLAENEQGLRNLFLLSSRASVEGQLAKWPRMDAEIISQHSEGIIGTTGCPNGEVQTRLRLGQFYEALEAAAKWQDIFGKDNYFLELMDHGISRESRVREELLELGRQLNIPPLATNDCHYLHHSDFQRHDAILCVQTGKTLSDPTRLRLPSEEYYFKSPQQMRSLWDRSVPGACDNTLLIAERVSSYENVWKPRSLMPQFEVPEGYDDNSWLAEEVTRGLEARFQGNAVPPAYIQRAEYELSIINPMGFAAYFLIVADLISYARRSGIRVGPGRGSAAGSLVAWALGIVNVDPIEFGLIFERFLNPDRISMPDIDIDFDDRRRGEMIRYATEKFGAERVAQVITFGTIKTKAALKDSARAHYGQPGFSLADKISKALPPAIMAKDIPLRGIYDENHERYKEATEVRALLESDPDLTKIYETALGLEGLIRNAGVHACAVIMSADPLTHNIPVWKRPNDGAIITGWDYPACEAIGLLKMDFLGLRNLTVIGDCLENIRINKKIDVDIENVPLDDPAAYKLLAQGNTLGVFQLDSGPMRDLLRRLAPTCFEDIIAVIALYRPGPMGMNAHNDFADRKNGRKEIVPIHPDLAEPLEEILEETYGLIVYQEQIMKIAQTVASYTLARADILRKAMGKKKEEVLLAEFEGFSEGMKSNSYSDQAIQALWDTILPFAGYAFNKSHAAGYGMVSYWTAYLKANYPAEYMAALLTSVGDDKDKAAIYLADCRHLGIKVLPPDVNEAQMVFTPVGEDIVFGLASIRNVGANVVSSIIASREKHGKFKDFTDYLNKIDSAACSKKVTESLLKAGAFDGLGHPRKGIYLVHSDAIDAVSNIKKALSKGQFDLFAGQSNSGSDEVFTVKIPDEEWDTKEKLSLERHMLGLYVTGHPLEKISKSLKKHTDTTVTQIHGQEVSDGKQVKIGGIVSSVVRKVNKNGAPFSSLIVEDSSGAMIETYLFPATYAKYGELVVEDSIVVVKARVNYREDKAVLIAQEVEFPQLQESNTELTLTIPVHLCSEDSITQLKKLLVQHKGDNSMDLMLTSGEHSIHFELDPRYTISPSTELLGDLKQLFGPQCVQ